MSSNSQTPAAEEEAKSMLVPKLRFPEFRDEKGWGERPLSEFMSESRLLGSKGNVAKKITVKLWGNGVYKKTTPSKAVSTLSILGAMLDSSFTANSIF